MTAQDTIAEQLDAVNIEIDSVTSKLERLYDEERAWQVRNNGQPQLQIDRDETTRLEDRWAHLENYKLTLQEALEL